MKRKKLIDTILITIFGMCIFTMTVLMLSCGKKSNPVVTPVQTNISVVDNKNHYKFTFEMININSPNYMLNPVNGDTLVNTNCIIQDTFSLVKNSPVYLYGNSSFFIETAIKQSNGNFQGYSDGDTLKIKLYKNNQIVIDTMSINGILDLSYPCPIISNVKNN